MSKNFLTKLYFIKEIKIRSKEEVLSDAVSHWEQLLIETIELKEFRISDHIYKDSINASGIPVINNEPRFILHSLPEEKELKRKADNDELEVRYYKSLLIHCGLSFVKWYLFPL